VLLGWAVDPVPAQHAVREVFDLGENAVSRTLAAINDNHRLSLHRKPPPCSSPINVNLHSNAHLHSLRKVFVGKTEPVGGRVWCCPHSGSALDTGASQIRTGASGARALQQAQLFLVNQRTQLEVGICCDLKQFLSDLNVENIDQGDHSSVDCRGD